MKTIEKYQGIAENYVNGNLKDFRKDLKKLTKKELMVYEVLFSDYFFTVQDNHGLVKANNIIHKFL